MKVVIAGAGSVGVAITEDLDAKGYQVTLLERDQELAEKLRATTRLNIALVKYQAWMQPVSLRPTSS